MAKYQATYVSNSAGWQALATSDLIASATKDEAARAQAMAEEMSADFVDTGEYASSFTTGSAYVELETSHGTHLVAAGRVENFSTHAAAVEWGNSYNHKPHRVFGRVVDALSND